MIGFEVGLLTVESQASSAPGNARWNCRCACGSAVVRTGNDLRTGKTKSCGCQRGVGGGPRPSYKSKHSYKTAHAAVRRLKGSAKNHRCVDCGGRAADWSLRHGAASVHVGDNGRGAMCAFSADPLDYEPRCRTCHRRYDWEERSD